MVLFVSHVSQERARHQFCRDRHLKRNHDALANERKDVKKIIGGRKKRDVEYAVIHQRLPLYLACWFLIYIYSDT